MRLVPKGDSTALITTARDHLIDITTRLMQALPAERLQDPANPVLVSVRGSYFGGKKLVPDTAREALCASIDGFSGKAKHDERWQGRRADGSKIEVAFINAAWRSDLYSDLAWLGMRPDEVLKAFLAQRKHGGVTFVHNYPGFGAHTAALEMWIEDRGVQDHKTEDGRLISAKPALRAAFNRLAAENPLPKRADELEWLRYVEVIVADPALRADARMKSYLASLRPEKRGVPVMEKNVAHVKPAVPEFQRRRYML